MSTCKQDDVVVSLRTVTTPGSKHVAPDVVKCLGNVGVRSAGSVGDTLQALHHPVIEVIPVETDN